MQPNNLKTHILYWILPSTVTLLCIVFYFFNIYGLGGIIAPLINREFGVVENIQLLILLLIFFTSLQGIRNRTIKIEKYLFVVIAAGTAILFLEEIDYGLHYIEYFSGERSGAVAPVVLGENKIRNIHNNGKLTSVFKMTSYFIIVLFFVLLPLTPKRYKEKYSLVNFFSPSRNIIFTAISLLVLNQVALLLFKSYNYSNGALDGNVSEFEEIMTYYIMFLFLRELVNKPEGTLLRKSGSTISAASASINEDRSKRVFEEV